MGLQATSWEAAGVAVEGVAGGQGRPLLFLHGGFGLPGNEAFLEHLAADHAVLAPCHPGFGRSELPRAYSTVSDLAFFYLDLINQLELDDAVLVGSCFGGWIANEILIRNSARFGHLVLIDALGVKFGDHLSRDIADIHAMTKDEVARTLYCDPALGQPDTTVMSDAELTGIVRDRESFALFGWKPYMHDPALRRWLHRIDLPTLVLWGASDAMVTTAYGRNYATAIAGARFQEIAAAGHYPSIEQPEPTARAILEFLVAAGSESPAMQGDAA